MSILSKLNIKSILNIAKKSTAQQIALPDGSIITIKVSPKFEGKTEIMLTWDKNIDNVDLHLSIGGQPIKISQGDIECPNLKEIQLKKINPKETNKISAEFKATKSF